VKRKSLSKLIIVVSLVAVLAIVVPFISGCIGKPAAAPPEAPPAAAPPEAPPEEAPPPPKEITAKIGYNMPLTGEVSGWALPGMWGSEILVDNVNAAGGIVLADGTHVMLEIVPYDNEYIPDKALSGAKKLVLEDEVSFIQMLGGPTASTVIPWLTQQGMISTSLSSTDLSPETPYHFVPTEANPLIEVTQFNYLKEHYPEVETIALTVQDDEFGRMLMGSCGASAESAGLEIVYAELHAWDTADFAPIVAAMLANDPDIFATVGSYATNSVLMFEQAYLQGFDGKIQQGGFDLLPELIEKTSVEFLEGGISIFPPFDDPMLDPRWNEFYAEYIQRHPDQWGVVSWEYAADLELWIAGVEAAGSIEPIEVFQAVKALPNPPHAFGEGVWWGYPLWGNDNVVVTDWPVCEMRNGVPRIQEFTDIMGWWEENKELLIDWQEEYDMMWYQKLGIPKQTAIDEYGLLD